MRILTNQRIRTLGNELSYIKAAEQFDETIIDRLSGLDEITVPDDEAQEDEWAEEFGRVCHRVRVIAAGGADPEFDFLAELTIEQLEEFDTACKSYGVSPRALLRNFVTRTIQAWELGLPVQEKNDE